MGYCLNRLDEPIFIAVTKPLLTKFAIHHRLESCELCYIALKLAKNQLKQLKVRILDVHFFPIFVKSKSKAHNLLSHHEILIDISHIRLVEPGTTGWGLAKMDEHCWKSLSHPVLLTKTLVWLK